MLAALLRLSTPILLISACLVGRTATAADPFCNDGRKNWTGVADLHKTIWRERQNDQIALRLLWLDANDEEAKGMKQFYPSGTQLGFVWPYPYATTGFPQTTIDSL